MCRCEEIRHKEIAVQTYGPCEEAGLTLEELLERTETERDKLQVQRDELQTRVVFLEDELTFMTSQFALLRQNSENGLFLKLSEDEAGFERPSGSSLASMSTCAGFERPSGSSLASMSTCASTSQNGDRPLVHGSVVPSPDKAQALSLPTDDRHLCDAAMKKLKTAFLANDTAKAYSVVQQMVASQEQVRSPRENSTLSLGTSLDTEDVHEQFSSGQISLSFSCDLSWSLMKSSHARANDWPLNSHESRPDDWEWNGMKWQKPIEKPGRITNWQKPSSQNDWHKPSSHSDWRKPSSHSERHKPSSRSDWHKPSSRSDWHQPSSHSDWHEPCFPETPKWPVQPARMLEEARHPATLDYATQSRRVQHGVLLQEALGHRRHSDDAQGVYEVTQFALKFRPQRPVPMAGPQTNSGLAKIETKMTALPQDRKVKTACAFHFGAFSTLVPATTPL